MAKATMAKPKRRKSAAATPVKAIGIRANPEWVEWVERLARHFRTTSVGIIDRALSEFAKAQDYPEPPPDRLS